MTCTRLPALLLLLASGLAQAESPDSSLTGPSWRAGGGGLTLELRADYLPDFGIEILHEGEPVTGRKSLPFRLEAIEPLGLNVRWGNVESLQPGSGPLVADASLAFRRNDRMVQIDGLRLEPASHEGHPVIAVLDAQGRGLFTLSHIHMELRPDSGWLSAANAEVEASAHLAQRLGFEELAGMPIGTARLKLALEGGARSEPAGLPAECDGRPLWPQDAEGADIELIGMDNVAYQGTHPDGRIKIAPSATLRNRSDVDIPWIRQFEVLGSYPYVPRDQHAYLVWNLYRIDDGRIEMLAGSGAKHAFYTVNQDCDFACGSNNVVWPGCKDVYSAGSNDMSAHQGPRPEIAASLGLWDSCGSFFDPDCDGAQDGYAGQWQHRLLVDPAELQKSGAEYLLDAWYVVQYDVDIWNTMGYRLVNFEPSGSGWLVNETDQFIQDPALSRWVAEADGDPGTDHDIIVVPPEDPGAEYPDNMPQGHLRLAVSVTETEPGRYRYNYALQNYDFDRALEGFRIDLPGNATVFDTFFGDVDEDNGNDWQVDVDSDYVLFRAPPDNALGWFTLYNFEIETDAPPNGSRVLLDLCGDGDATEIDVETIAPASGTNLIFEDAFSGTTC